MYRAEHRPQMAFLETSLAEEMALSPRYRCQLPRLWQFPRRPTLLPPRNLSKFTKLPAPYVRYKRLVMM